MTKTRNQIIRDSLGHCPPECRVKISRLGKVSRYGSPNPSDRSKDFWSFCGWAEEWEKQHAPDQIIFYAQLLSDQKQEME